jgi:acetyl esterase/lipase
MPDRVAYGELPDQYAVRSGPRGGAHPRALVLHGGFWRAQYTLELMDGVCAALADLGWESWNAEYRRVGAGGGYPETLDDVAAACEAFRPQLALGHSAGGHLALWAAAEGLVDTAVSLAGVCDLAAGARRRLGNGAVLDFMGGTPEELPKAYARADPAARLPLPARAVVVHGTADDTVPVELSRSFAAAAGCDLVELGGVGHMEVIDPRDPSWHRIASTLTP